MVPITLPRFVPASNSDHVGQDNAANCGDMTGMSNGVIGQGNGLGRKDLSDPLDFDLLAEYLLDDVSIPTLSSNLNAAVGQDSMFNANVNNDCVFTVESGYWYVCLLLDIFYVTLNYSP